MRKNIAKIFSALRAAISIKKSMEKHSKKFSALRAAISIKKSIEKHIKNVFRAARGSLRR